MHVRDLCLCAECIARLVVDDDEQRVNALALIHSTGRRKQSVQVADGVRRRRKS